MNRYRSGCTAFRRMNAGRASMFVDRVRSCEHVRSSITVRARRVLWPGSELRLQSPVGVTRRTASSFDSKLERFGLSSRPRSPVRGLLGSILALRADGHRTQMNRFSALGSLLVTAFLLAACGGTPEVPNPGGINGEGGGVSGGGRDGSGGTSYDLGGGTGVDAGTSSIGDGGTPGDD